MTAAEIIREIEALPPQEQKKIAHFVQQLARQRKLSPTELGHLAKELAATNDPVEAVMLREGIVHGFYDGPTPLRQLDGESQARLDTLMTRNNEGQLTTAEREEFAHVAERAHEMSMANARTLLAKQRRIGS